MASTDVEHSDDIDTGWRHEPADAPSARFGWHGVATRNFYVAGWISVVILLCMLVGNHVGHVEDIWLIASALIVAAFILRGMFAKKQWK
ncbi:DUF2631 domain-containing protein [Gordonia desulfuricans]|uniref:DUF2631 domain-containing protein n=1 Tax=Gordonia desulfuricans TaxID=89051 RepID=A0A7K3LWQ3_9ACTN|nr:MULTISPECIES: DUF2631 domain-containing protein [Gordonia]EMP12745.1 hypothetical protein ISGA_3765 [Gordonia sp. NB41Y]NDK91987.1 DUF2631 domain-containing protein [Gordonia desulfuricans]WLP91185.1 DUF2631 domain-containing protein [Gordonia sp. NB41Y]